MVHQWQHGVTGQTEDSYHGHDPGPTTRQTRSATGSSCPVRAGKKRARTGTYRPVPSYWPHIVRPAEHCGRYERPADQNWRDHVEIIAAGLRPAHAATVAAGQSSKNDHGLFDPAISHSRCWQPHGQSH
jgi:hypothetical protein